MHQLLTKSLEDLSTEYERLCEREAILLSMQAQGIKGMDPTMFEQIDKYKKAYAVAISLAATAETHKKGTRH